MARNARLRGARRTLLALLVLAITLFGGLGAAAQWGSPPAQWTPQLGLDLAGGRQIVIEPVVTGSETVSAEQVDQAADIIRRRVDGAGVAEAEVSRLGATSIVVSIPGSPSAEQLESLSRASQLRFRTVLLSAPAIPEQQAPPTPTSQFPLPTPPAVEVPGTSPTGTEPPSLTGTDPGTGEETGEGAGEETGEGTGSGAGESSPAATSGAYPEGLLAAGSTTSPTATDAPATDAPPTDPGTTDVPTTDVPTSDAPTSTGDQAPVTDGGDTTAGPTEAPVGPEPTDASDLAWITPELQQQFAELDCQDGDAAEAAAAADPAQPVVACSVGGVEKYVLGPSELTGAEVSDASSGPVLNQVGQPTGGVEVRLNLTDTGRQIFRDVTTRLFGYPNGADQNRFAIVLDGQVISAPRVNSPITDGNASISGGFTTESAEALANQLRFGALPISFEVQTNEQISPTLGEEQLEVGIVAGIIGLAAVFVYSLVQYRALGLVTVSSLVVAAILTYGVVTFLGWAINFRLTMAGIAGLIVGIGITADSFIVYFERVRDEVRAGRPLRYAVDTGWARARRTILISDAVNLMAAGVLYWLSDAGVRAFAFALGVSTVIDLLVVVMFTRPVVSVLASTRFFGEGHRLSGMDPERLGAKRSTYLGRGQWSPPERPRTGPTREQLEGGVV